MSLAKRINGPCVIGRNAFIGCGYADRSQAFDLQVSLQDHFKRVKKEQEIAQEQETPKPALDLGFKEGETIKINMKITVRLYNYSRNAGMLNDVECFTMYPNFCTLLEKGWFRRFRSYKT